MTTQTINASDVQTILNLIPRSQFFTVLFTKKPGKFDVVGEERVMNCRRGVKAFLAPANPDKAKRAPAAEDVIKVWDAQIRDYRSFKTGSVKMIKALGQQFVVA